MLRPFRRRLDDVLPVHVPGVPAAGLLRFGGSTDVLLVHVLGDRYESGVAASGWGQSD